MILSPEKKTSNTKAQSKIRASKQSDYIFISEWNTSKVKIGCSNQTDIFLTQFLLNSRTSQDSSWWVWRYKLTFETKKGRQLARSLLPMDSGIKMASSHLLYHLKIKAAKFLGGVWKLFRLSFFFLFIIMFI
jgi:hypothetical protein